MGKQAKKALETAIHYETSALAYKTMVAFYKANGIIDEEGNVNRGEHPGKITPELDALCKDCDKKLDAFANTVDRNLASQMLDANEPNSLAKAFLRNVKEDFKGTKFHSGIMGSFSSPPKPSEKYNKAVAEFNRVLRDDDSTLSKSLDAAKSVTYHGWQQLAEKAMEADKDLAAKLAIAKKGAVKNAGYPDRHDQNGVELRDDIMKILSADPLFKMLENDETRKSMVGYIASSLVIPTTWPKDPDRAEASEYPIGNQQRDFRVIEKKAMPSMEKLVANPEFLKVARGVTYPDLYGRKGPTPVLSGQFAEISFRNLFEVGKRNNFEKIDRLQDSNAKFVTDMEYMSADPVVPASGIGIRYRPEPGAEEQYKEQEALNKKVAKLAPVTVFFPGDSVYPKGDGGGEAPKQTEILAQVSDHQILSVFPEVKNAALAEAKRAVKAACKYKYPVYVENSKNNTAPEIKLMTSLGKAPVGDQPGLTEHGGDHIPPPHPATHE